EGDGCEIQHRLRGERIEMGHCLVRARDDEIDLIRFGAERCFITREDVRRWNSFALRNGFESQSDPLDRAQTPGDPSRKKRIDEGERMWHQRPPLANGPSEAMLNVWPERDRHHQGCITERAPQRRISLEQ